MHFIKNLLSLRKFTFLLTQLVKRDFKIKYRGSLLGILWSVLNPLLNMIVLSIVFSHVFRAVDNYKMYLLSGIVIFNFFSEATNITTNSVVSNFGLLTKVYFPKFIIPLSKVLFFAINFMINIFVFMILGIFMEIKPWIGYLLIPYVMVCVLTFTMGVSFILSTLQVFFRDTQHLYSVITTIWMYATPILYPIETITSPALLAVFKINPMYVFVDFLRQITLYSSVPPVESFLSCALWAVGMFIIGGIIFVKNQSKFIYYT